MNSQRKNYPMKEFGAVFPISSILVIMRKKHFSILAVFQNVWDLHKFGLQIWIQNAKITLWKNFGQFFRFIDFGHQVRVCKKRSFLNISCNSKYMGFTEISVADLNSERKNYPMKEFLAIFLISLILVIRSAYAKQGRFWILAVFQHIWDLHKFGLQIWIQNAKITLWKNFGQFFRFHQFWSSSPSMQKKIISQYYLQFKIYGTYINLGCRFGFRTQKLPHERISGNFSFFINFGHHAKKGHFSILAVFQYGIYINLGCRFEFRTQKLPYERISGNFFNFINFGHQVRVCKKRSFFNISCNSKYMWFT